MNKFAFKIRFITTVFFLRFRYLMYYKIPSRQIYAFYITKKLFKILETKKINIFLTGGSLLGAVRQGSFAGRPADVDLGIKDSEVENLLNSLPIIIKGGARTIRQEPKDKIERIQILFPCILVDISIYRKKNVNKKEVWIGEVDDPKSKFLGYHMPIENLENLVPIKIFNERFLSPSNPQIYLEQVYGKNWQILEKEQFVWKKNSIN